MRPIRDQYLRAAAHLVQAIESKAVDSTSWADPSVLPGFTIGGLVAHFGQQITSVAAALEADHTGKAVIGLFDHYGRAAWLGADIDNDYNTAIRRSGETAAAEGRGIIDQARAALETLREILPRLPDDHIAGNPRWPYAMTLDDFLITRIMEIVVHDDDLNASLPRVHTDFDQDVFDTATWVLARLAAKRHGQAALIRALARSERAPESISGL